jgi:microcystin degradation protein MlrC
MHGAMVAEGYDDCEGDTLARVREIVGPDTVVGIELDLHCHLTEQMSAMATAIVTYKEYPHTDIAKRARDLFALCARAQRGEVQPVIACYDCRMVNMWRTPQEPMRSFVQRMQALENNDGILSVSFGHGFPLGRCSRCRGQDPRCCGRRSREGELARPTAGSGNLGAPARDDSSARHDRRGDRRRPSGAKGPLGVSGRRR